MIARILKRREVITVGGVVALLAIVAAFNPSFVEPSNLSRVLNSAVILMLLAAGVGTVIITRNIDVSVGSTLALSGIVGGLMMRDGTPIPVAILVVLLLGALLGLVNGVGVTYGHVPSIVMTLGTLGAYRGISFLITGGYSVESIPTGYRAVGRMELLGIPVLVVGAVVLLTIFAILMSKTNLGRQIYATGDNTTGARLIGVRTNGVTILAFTISGLFAAAAALVFLAQIGSISNQAGAAIEMRAIAAAVIGGIALTGGVGTVFGAVVGALFITAATSSLSFLGIPGFWADTVIGAILLVALFTDARVRTALDKRRIVERYRAVALAHEQDGDRSAEVKS